MPDQHGHEIEIVAQVSNQSGELGRLVGVIATNGAKITACRSDHNEDGCVVHLMIETEDIRALLRELADAGFVFETRPPLHALSVL